MLKSLIRVFTRFSFSRCGVLCKTGKTNAVSLGLEEEEMVDAMLMDLDTQIHHSFYGGFPFFTEEEEELLPAYWKLENACLEIQWQFLSLRSRQMLGNKVQLIEVERVAQQLQQVEEQVEKEQQTT